MMKYVFLYSVLILVQGCTLINKKGSWGKNSLYPIRGERILHALKKNASSPHVWGPLAGAGIFAVTNIDKKMSEWVQHEGHVFKNKDAADNWSDNFNNIQKYEMYGVILLTPSHDEDMSFGGYLLNKARGGFALNIAASSSRFGVDQIRKVVHRERPNQLDFKSLPSGHAAEAGSRSAIIRKGSASIDMNKELHFSINTLNTAMAIGTAWARVEGKRHYPSDVMAGYAFGTFISGFVFDSIINYDTNQTFGFIPQKDKQTFLYSINF